jgi:hypothetical protein
VALAGADERVDDGRALPRLGVADEQPVPLAQRRGPDGVFYSEMAITPSGVQTARFLSPARTDSGRRGLGVISDVSNSILLHILTRFQWRHRCSP